MSAYLGTLPVSIKEAFYRNHSTVDLLAKGTSVLGEAPKLVANFTTGEYKASGVAKTFEDLFTFTRAGKAWLVKDTGLQEYAADVPRFDDGLLIEQSATNQALDSLIKNGVSSFDIKASSLLTISADTQLGIGNKVSFPQGFLSYAYKTIPLADEGSHTLTSYVSKSDGSTDIILGRESSEDALLVGADRSAFTYKNMRHGLVRVSGVSNSSSNRGIVRYAEQITRTGNLRLHALQLESGSKVTSLIVTEATPVTRPADFLLNNITGTTVTGDWDSTLTLSIVDGQLVHSGYGRIRSLEIN